MVANLLMLFMFPFIALGYVWGVIATAFGAGAQAAEKALGSFAEQQVEKLKGGVE